MRAISGFVPTGQVIDLSARAAALPHPSAQRRRRAAVRSLAGFVLLLLGFLLILLGGTLFAPQLPEGERLPVSLGDETIATAATFVGRAPWRYCLSWSSLVRW